jgi:DMSO/TMAO reductase YedYZ molybdopterin-dependent catalytic subunit
MGSRASTARASGTADSRHDPRLDTPDPNVRVPEPPREVPSPRADALCIESPLSALDAEFTSTPDFFVRNHFPIPQVDLADWRLRVEGDVEQSLALSYPEFLALHHEHVDALMECAGNSRSSVRPRPEGVLWRNGAVGTASWDGVPLHTVLERAGVRPGSVEVMFEGADRGLEPGVDREIGFAMSITLTKAMDPATLLADRMNGQPLSARHGFPVRAVVPGWYGMASVKWLTRIVVLRHPFQGHFRARAYAYIPEGEAADAAHRPVTSVQVKSLFTWPGEGDVLPSGQHRVRGVAWSGGVAIDRVEVSSSSMSESPEREIWHPATLFPGETTFVWTHWEYDCDLRRPGFYVLRVRAIDAQGNAQPMIADWNFNGLGNNPVHAVPVEIRPSPRLGAPRGRSSELSEE